MLAVLCLEMLLVAKVDQCVQAVDGLGPYVTALAAVAAVRAAELDESLAAETDTARTARARAQIYLNKILKLHELSFT